MSQFLQKYLRKLAMGNPAAGKVGSDTMKLSILNAFKTAHPSGAADKAVNNLAHELGPFESTFLSPMEELAQKAGMSRSKLMEVGGHVGQKIDDTAKFGKWSELGQPNSKQTLDIKQGLWEKLERDKSRTRMEFHSGSYPDEDYLEQMMKKVSKTSDDQKKIGGILDDYSRASFERGLPRTDDLVDGDIEKAIPGFTKWMEKKKLNR